jgi:hypothetical protein
LNFTTVPPGYTLKRQSQAARCKAAGRCSFRASHIQHRTSNIEAAVINRKKQWLIDEIREFNRSAEPAFLDNFDLRSLDSYLERLTRLHGRRGRDSVWVREGDTPAIVSDE